MLVRGASSRFTADVPSSTRDLARYLHRALVSRTGASSPAARAFARACMPALLATRRSYATTAAATKPTATVKKAVKATAAAKTTPAKTAVKPRTTTAAKKTTAKKATVKKATAKKATAKGATARTVGAKKAAPKKAAKKKAAPKKRATRKRVPLTPEQKQKAKITELRKKILPEPVSYRSISAHILFSAEHVKGTHEGVVNALKQSLEKFKTLTPAEREHYNHLAHERSAAKKAEYQAWIHSHTPEEIHAANLARRQLRRLTKDTQKAAPKHTTMLIDDRKVKAVAGPYPQFFGDRYRSGDFKGISVTDASRLVAAEWKALSAAEKKKYEDLAAQDKVRRERELAAMA